MDKKSDSARGVFEEKDSSDAPVAISTEAKDSQYTDDGPIFKDEIETLQENLRLVLDMRELSLKADGRLSLLESNAVTTLVGYIRAIDRQQECRPRYDAAQLSAINKLNADLKLNALRALFNLSVVDSITRRQIVKAGAIPLLLEAAEIDNTDAQPAAVGTLANLATESDIKLLIVQKGLHPLLRLLRSRDIAVKAHACRALFAIAANDDNKIAISEAGGLELLLECMQVGNIQVQINAAGALANLAIHPLNKPKLVESGALHILHTMAYSDYDKVQRQVARCLFALAAHADNRKHLVKTRCLTSLVFMLSTPNDEVQRNAAGAIGNIAMSDELKLTVVAQGALQPLIDLTTSESMLVQRQAARAIFTLSAKEEVKHMIVKTNGIQSLIALTGSTHEEIQRDSAGALANMAIGPGNKNLVIKFGALKPLISLLSSQHPMVQRQAARAMFALAGSTENQYLIVGAGGLAPLIKLLGSGTEVQKHAAGAIANLANNYASSIIHEAGSALYRVLDILLHNSNQEVRRQANRALINLMPPSVSMPIFKSRYVGISGEKHRLRHDMRRLYEETSSSVAGDKVAAPTFYDAVVCSRFDGVEYEVPFHKSIAFARSRKLDLLFVNTCSLTSDFGEEKITRLTPKEDYPKLVWLGLFEYLYTDSVRCNSVCLRSTQSNLQKLLSVAKRIGLSRLECACVDLLSDKSNPRYGLYTKSLRASTWVADMEYLTNRGIGFSCNKVAMFVLKGQEESEEMSVERGVKISRTRRSQRISFQHSSPRHFDLGMEEVESSPPCVPVHKELLVARCQYFRAQFCSRWADSGQSRIVFEGSKECLMVLTRYLYCGLDKVVVGKMKNNAELALEVLVYSNMYSMEGLTSQCESCLSALVSQSSVIELLIAIDNIFAPLLRAHCIYVILKTGLAFKESGLSKDLVEEIETYSSFWRFATGGNCL